MESQECTEEKPDIRVLMFGLDDAGKTTLLYKLKHGDDLVTKPTVGFTVETIEYEQHNYTIWDVGGQERMRELWRFYKTNTNSIIVFVVDAANSERYAEARKFLHEIMSDEELGNSKLLVLLNKQDKTNCVADKDLEQELDLKSLKQPYSIIGTSAIDCKGFNDIMMHLKSIKE